MTPKLTYMDSLLDRFGYSQTLKHGFLFFIGGAMLSCDQEQEPEKTQLAQNQLSMFDINEEYKELLGPLRDIYIQNHFEELIWRMEINIEPRQIKVPGSDVVVSEFTFKNYKRLRNDDGKITKLFDTADCLEAVFEGVGEELVSHEYDLSQSYKAGMCFFNLKAQVDVKSTGQLVNVISKSLTPTLSSVLKVANSTEVLFKEYSNIQIGIICLISSLDREFSQTLWAYQSYVFYDQGDEIPGVADMPLDAFIDHCRSRALFFYANNSHALYDIANKRVHWNTFPALQSEFDERQVVKQSIQNSWGLPEKNTQYGEIDLKSIIVFSYFCSVCETVLLAAGKITNH